MLGHAGSVEDLRESASGCFVCGRGRQLQYLRSAVPRIRNKPFESGRQGSATHSDRNRAEWRFERSKRVDYVNECCRFARC